MRMSLLVLGVICGWLAFEARATACSCLPPDLGRSYQSADHVVHVRVQGLLFRTRTTQLYFAQLVEADYKGCLEAGQRVVIETPTSSAACGVSLSRGEYLLHGDRAGSLLGRPRLRVSLCDANVRWRELGEEQRAFLDTRYVCCGDECGCSDGSEPAKCFVDPCRVSACDVEGATCKANYCGGCRAEWHDPSGELVCDEGDGCAPESDSLHYVARTPEQCATVRFACEPGSEPFFSECGCGCVATTSCAVGGCSGQLCLEPGDDRVTTCEFRPEYACYESAACERQGDGRCAWTETPALSACLEASRGR